MAATLRAFLHGTLFVTFSLAEATRVIGSPELSIPIRGPRRAVPVARNGEES